MVVTADKMAESKVICTQQKYIAEKAQLADLRSCRRDPLSTEMSEDEQPGCHLVTTFVPRELIDCGSAFYGRNS